MRKAALRETSEITSKLIGYLEAGETVAVTAVDGYRLKVLRLKWGAQPWKQPGTGWVSERDQEGEGEVLLERLPRSEWSATAQHETALAERISQLRKMYGVYTFHGRKPVDKMGTLLERYDPPLPSDPSFAVGLRSRWRSRWANEGGSMGSKEKRFAAAVLSECEDVNDVDALLKRLEQTP